jgi:hypothetical protein
MTFADWRQLSPAEAARTLRARVVASLSPAQQHAAIATLTAEEELATRFAAAPRSGPLGGVPYFAKDLFDVAGVPTLAGSTFLPEVRPTRAKDGAFVAAMNAAGAVLAGKTHMHEFASSPVKIRITVTWSCRSILGARRAARAAARRRWSRRTSCRSRLAATRAARYVCRRRSAGCSAFA